MLVFSDGAPDGAARRGAGRGAGRDTRLVTLLAPQNPPNAKTIEVTKK